jgi:hypothetical protein
MLIRMHRQHPLLRLQGPAVCKNELRFIQYIYDITNNDEADRVVIAYRDHQRVGWLRIGFLCQSRPQVVYAMGTWTHPRYRRKRIAIRVWQHMIHCLQPSHIEVGTVSKAGSRLVGSLRAQYPDIQWIHNGSRF